MSMQEWQQAFQLLDAIGNLASNQVFGCGCKDYQLALIQKLGEQELIRGKLLT